MLEHYNKSALTTEQLIKKLEDKGFSITEKKTITHFLNHVSYYRFKAYIRHFSTPNQTNINDVIKLYEFDSKLRGLLLSTIETIEISTRALLINTYSLEFGANWYEDKALFVDENKHTILISKIEESIDKVPQELFIKHYNNKYHTPPNPPSWMTFEVISFGTLSHTFRQLKIDKTKKSIAKAFAISNVKTLQSWLHTFVYLRNIAAHHSRIWNKVLHIKPRFLKKPNKAWINTKGIKNDRLYLSISCLQYALNAVKPNNNFSTQLKSLLQQYPSVDISNMGFPTNWKSQPLWK